MFLLSCAALNCVLLCVLWRQEWRLAYASLELAGGSLHYTVLATVPRAEVLEASTAIASEVRQCVSE